MIVTKSYGPSTAHWLTIRAPIASICAFTCCRRLGFFFSVSTPVADSVESRTYVCTARRLPALAAGDGRGALGRARLELVVERLQRAAAAPLERVLEQLVGDPRVLRQQRPVHVRADDPLAPAALGAVLAVVAGAGDHPPERLDAAAEPGAAGVVLEADHGAAVAAVDEHVPDQARLAGHGLEVDEAGAGDVVALVPPVAVPEQLVAAAHGEHARAVGERLAQPRRLPDQLLRHQHLVAVLAPAEQDHVGPARVEVRAQRERLDTVLEAAPGTALLEHADDAAVGVDGQQRGVDGN